MGEADFLAWLAERGPRDDALEVAIGDDAAVWRLPSGERLVVAADAVAEGTHFARGEQPELVGRKALACNLSDLAAMGARPLFALATATLPRGFPEELPRRLHRGMTELGAAWGCPLIGGDTLTHEAGVVLSVTVVGTPFEGGPVERRGARPGDRLVVTGALGGSSAGRHLRFDPRLREAEEVLRLGPPHAMMDLSDGLGLDLWRLADASGVDFEVDLRWLPIAPEARGLPDPAAARQAALTDGEDFELLLSLDPGQWEMVRAAWPAELAPLTVVGTVLRRGAGRLYRDEAGTHAARPQGYEHC